MRYISKPFKGNIAYEWQIWCVVFMLYYPHAPLAKHRKHWRFNVWYDSHWRCKYHYRWPLQCVVINWLLCKYGKQSHTMDHGNELLVRIWGPLSMYEMPSQDLIVSAWRWSWLV